MVMVRITNKISVPLGTVLRKYYLTIGALPIGVLLFICLWKTQTTASELPFALSYGPFYGFFRPWAVYAGWTITVILAWVADELRTYKTGWIGACCLAGWFDALLILILIYVPTTTGREYPIWTETPSSLALLVGSVGLALVHLPLILALLTKR